MNKKKIHKLILFLSFFKFIFSECSDLDYNTCLYYPDYCSWDEATGSCFENGDFDTGGDGGGSDGGGNNGFIEPSCIPFDQTDPIPYNTTEYANMCIEYVGVPPTVDCGDGVHIPIYVNGVEVFDDQPFGSCDDPDFKGTCNIGSRVGRIEGIDINGNSLPNVVWVFFCRSSGQDLFNQTGSVSVQMIGYNTENGATCFFESPDAVGNNIQSEYLFYDQNGHLDGTLPAFGTSEFDELFHSPTVSQTNCMSCHTADPFIHDPWIDNAKLPNNPSETVIPKYEYDGIDLPYFAVGGYGSQFSNKSVYIEGNNCNSCHRSSMELATNVFDGLGNVLVNESMPPYAPGTLSDDYNELIDCYNNNPENTDNCYWLIPPGGSCDSEIIGLEDIDVNGDLNGDNVVNILDIVLVVNLILDNEYSEIGDLNFDSSINILDIVLLANIILDDQGLTFRTIKNHPHITSKHLNLDVINKWIKK